MANTHELATTDYMNAQRIVQNCVLKNQSTVIEEMIRANLISEEYLYPFADDVMEWWLTIQRAGDLHGWRNTRNLRERLTQLTTNKVSIPYSLLLDRNFVFQKFDTATIPKSGIRSLRFQNMFFTFVDDILKFTEA